MKDTVQMVARILREEDVEGLIGIGAPSDEYDVEAEMIWRAMEADPKLSTQEQIAALVGRVWNEMLGPFSKEETEKRMPAFCQVARRIRDSAASEASR
jgi:hypothetical protein